MDEQVKAAIMARVAAEPYVKKLGISVMNLDTGTAVVEMPYDEDIRNIFGSAHGGAIFSLIDEAFELACNSHGTMAVALNVNVTYMAAPGEGTRLRATAIEVNRTRRTGTYDIRVTDADGTLIATCQALAYRLQKPLPFL